VVGNPTHINLLGPTAGAWSREPGEYSRVAYFSTDGGHINPFKGKNAVVLIGNSTSHIVMYLCTSSLE
jgi:hypothetical protein